MRLAVPIAALAVLLGQALPEPLGSLVAYGPVGIGVALWLAGWLPSKAELERALARAERAEAQRDAMTEKVLGEILPMIGVINGSMIPTAERMANEMRGVADEVRRVGDRVSNIEQGRRS